jgi:uncharacterized short protein YbdD (DUF466 family)
VPRPLQVLLDAARALARAVPAVVGAPDYERYVAFLREADPGCPVPDRAEFERERLAARYARPGARCC